MYREFDIFLKNHVTECDLLIYSIPYRDGISVTNRLILDAVLRDYSVCKAIAAESKMEIEAHIDDMIKLCRERLNSGVLLDASIDIGMRGILPVQNDPIILDIPPVQIFRHDYEQIGNLLNLDAEVVETQTSLSTGKIKSVPLLLSADVTGIGKTSKIEVLNGFEPNAKIFEMRQHSFIDALFATGICASAQSLSYHLYSGAASALEMMAMVIGTEIKHSLGRWYNGFPIDAVVRETKVQKFEKGNATFCFFENATGTPKKVLYPNDCGTSLNAEDVNFGLKRYRLLSDIDDLTLEDIDDMTLEELDYVELT